MKSRPRELDDFLKISSPRDAAWAMRRPGESFPPRFSSEVLSIRRGTEIRTEEMLLARRHFFVVEGRLQYLRRDLVGEAKGTNVPFARASHRSVSSEEMRRHLLFFLTIFFASLIAFPQPTIV